MGHHGVVDIKNEAAVRTCHQFMLAAAGQIAAGEVEVNDHTRVGSCIAIKPVRRRWIRDSDIVLVAIRENVATLKRQGRSLDEAIAAKPTAAFDAKWGQFLITPALFTKLVYEGV